MRQIRDGRKTNFFFQSFSKTTVSLFRIETFRRNTILIRCYDYVKATKALQTYAWLLLACSQEEGETGFVRMY